MKQMKVLMVAMMAILGITFTSCLDSDSTPAQYAAIGEINHLTQSMRTDDGVTLYLQNFSALKYNDEYPKRALVYYQYIDGKDYTAGKTSYEVYFTGYYSVFNEGDFSMVEVESKTPIYAFGGEYPYIFNSGNYLNFEVAITYDENTNPEEDLMLYPYDVKNGVLYCKLVHKAELSGTTKNALVYMSFLLPEKSKITSEFDGLTFTGDDNNVIEVVVTAEGSNSQEFTTPKVKVALPNY